jgi:hypothetical protein
MISSPGFFFHPEASAPWMAKGESPLQLSHGGRAPGRNEKPGEEKDVKNELFKDE